MERTRAVCARCAYLPQRGCGSSRSGGVLGLIEMCSDEEEARDSGHSSERESMCSSSMLSGGGGSISGFSTDVSDTRRLSSGSEDSGFSTDVSDKRQAKCIRVREGRDNQDSFHRA